MTACGVSYGVTELYRFFHFVYNITRKHQVIVDMGVDFHVCIPHLLFFYCITLLSPLKEVSSLTERKYKGKLKTEHKEGFL